MQKITKIFATVLIGLSFASSAFALTDAERQSLILQLTQQLATLQAQLSQLLASPGTSAPQNWCHTFNTNLKLGMSGDDVSSLNTALSLQGFGVTSGNYFSESTRLAVVAFQERYASEILYPVNLSRGTGNVAAGTRRKLNQLYQCAPIAVLYPSGGETLQVGDIARITWKASGLPLNDQVIITVYAPANPYLNVKTIATVSATQGYFDWTISNRTLPSTSYPVTLKVKITSKANKTVFVDSNNFTVNSDANSQLNSISLVYPLGGQILYVGDTARITWTSKGLSSTDKVSISIFSSNNPYSNIKVIAPGVLASQEYFDWTISNTTLPSTSFPVQLRARVDVVNKNITSSSTSDFTVNSPSATNPGSATITIAYPVGGENYQYDEKTGKGDVPRITWNTTGFTSADRLNITVRPVETPNLNVKTISSSALAMQGYYDWRIGTSTIPNPVAGLHSVYVEVKSDNRNISDTSNPFTINFIPRQ